MDIKYFGFDALPGVKHFRCERMLASLSTTACASNWRLANDQQDLRRECCLGCSIGALHAGEVGLNTSPLRGKKICARCHRTNAPLLGKHVCPSCYNRALEVIKGRNAKGTKPVQHPPMDRRSISYVCAGEAKTKTLNMSVDADELIVAVLRDERRELQFEFRAAESLRQLGEGLDRSID